MNSKCPDCGCEHGCLCGDEVPVQKPTGKSTRHCFSSDYRDVMVTINETDMNIDVMIDCSKRGSFPDDNQLNTWLKLVIRDHISPKDHRSLRIRDNRMTLTVENSTLTDQAS